MCSKPLVITTIIYPHLNFFLRTLNAKTAKIHFAVNLQLLSDCFFN